MIEYNHDERRNMMHQPIQLLFALDDNYIPQLRVLLTSIYQNHFQEPFSIYVLFDHLKMENQESLKQLVQPWNWSLHLIAVDDSLFEDATITDRYPRQMYYRLLAPMVLPKDLDRILYLDPDILVINSLRPLWEMDLQGKIFAAASHTQTTELANTINKVRLNTEHAYYNSGVLLMDLQQARMKMNLDQMFQYVKDHAKELMFPDQDVLNALYGKEIYPLDDYLWNYDARNYSRYLLRSQGMSNVDWIMENTAILHFCGKSKPWKKNYPYRFGMLYKHYQKMEQRLRNEKSLD